MIIKINGKDTEIDAAQLTVTDLLKKANVESPDMVSVQLNGEFVDREKFDTVIVKPASAVDFLYFMGGGSVENYKGEEE